MRVLRTLSVVVLAACGQAQTNAQTNAQTPTTPAPGPPASQTAATATGETFVLEFDLPEEFGMIPAGSATAITGFRVGYFKGTEPTAIRALDFKRAALTVNGVTARVTVPRVGPSECGDDCVVRVQAVTSSATSPWSVPVSLTGRPVAVARPAPATARARARPQNLTLADVERVAPLLELLRTLLPADAKIEVEVARFRRTQHLAVAAVLSRDHGIPFTTLSRALEGPPPVLPRDALTRLRPELNARAVIMKARNEARKLFRTAPRR